MGLKMSLDSKIRNVLSFDFDGSSYTVADAFKVFDNDLEYVQMVVWSNHDLTSDKCSKWFGGFCTELREG